MSPHQERVVVEKAELDGRIDRLHNFFDNPIYNTLPPLDQLLLQAQYSLMNGLTQILTMRIARFRQEPES
jgi:hypothetical protein